MTIRKILFSGGLAGLVLAGAFGFVSAYAADETESAVEVTSEQIQPTASSQIVVVYDDKTYTLTLNSAGNYEVSLDGAVLGTITQEQFTQVSQALQVGVTDDMRALWGYENDSAFFEAFVQGQLRIIGSYQQVDEDGNLTEMFIFVDCQPKPAPEICPAKQYIGSDTDTQADYSDCISKDEYNIMYKWATRFNMEVSCPSSGTTTSGTTTSGTTSSDEPTSSGTTSSDEPTSSGTTSDRPPTGGFREIAPGVFMSTITPVIYLYSPQELSVSVDLEYDGQLTTYPEIGDGWRVKTKPNGKLINQADGREHNYLVWESVANSDRYFNMARGFVVKKSDTKDFLQTTLDKMGLTQSEANDFIGFWMGRLMQNEYNLIHFATTDEINRNLAKLKVLPQSDSNLRIFMAYQAADQNTQVLPQTIKKFTRYGFSLIEWGGAEVSEDS
ncbi:MAG: hypothetical protein LBU20_00490 [Candidatus Nomurabacteria bacterium]|nr:hypothetical protein [Candidatus Nomurabacteria bacterium]